MASLKSLMNCMDIDTGGQVSVLKRFFGFARGRVPTDPVTTATASVSILAQTRGIQGDYIHINVTRVGFDLLSGTVPGSTQTLLDQGREKIDYALYRTRNIYATVGVGVGRVLHTDINSSDAGGADDLGSEDEADDLIASWSWFNDGVDAFVVRNISGDFVGKASAIPGVCDKQDAEDGVVGGEIGRGFDAFARTFAHEIGHHMGLTHNHGGDPDCPDTTNGCNNLMAQTRCATSCGGGTRTAVLLTSSQATTMRNHCSIRPSC